MHIPPKPFRAREMKMSTERAVKEQKAHNQGNTAEHQGCQVWPSASQGIGSEQMRMNDKPSEVSAEYLGMWNSLFLTILPLPILWSLGSCNGCLPILCSTLT